MTDGTFTMGLKAPSDFPIEVSEVRKDDASYKGIAYHIFRFTKNVTLSCRSLRSTAAFANIPEPTDFLSSEAILETSPSTKKPKDSWNEIFLVPIFHFVGVCP